MLGLKFTAPLHPLSSHCVSKGPLDGALCLCALVCFPGQLAASAEGTRSFHKFIEHLLYISHCVGPGSPRPSRGLYPGGSHFPGFSVPLNIHGHKTVSVSEISLLSTSSFNFYDLSVGLLAPFYRCGNGGHRGEITGLGGEAELGFQSGLQNRVLPQVPCHSVKSNDQIVGPGLEFLSCFPLAM